MVSGKLVAGLVDVELQLQKATLAVKLHLKMLRKETQSPPAQSRESRDQIVALGKSIEAMQSELRTVTSEILTLAAKSLAVDTLEVASAGEETETEDEMEFEEEEKALDPVGPSPVKVKSEPQQQHPTTGATQQGGYIVKVELITDANEDASVTYGEHVHANPESKKRPCMGLDSDDREVKRRAGCDVVGTVERYARLAAVVQRQHKDNCSVVPPETALLKKATTEATVAVLEWLQAGQLFDEATRTSFCAATTQLVDVICGLSKDTVESSLIEETLNGITNIARTVNP